MNFRTISIFHIKMLHQYKANTGHRFIAELEEAKTVHVITQNIDGLHQDAGSTNVLKFMDPLRELIVRAVKKSMT